MTQMDLQYTLRLLAWLKQKPGWHHQSEIYSQFMEYITPPVVTRKKQAELDAVNIPRYLQMLTRTGALIRKRVGWSWQYKVK